MTELEIISRCVELIWDFGEIYDYDDVEHFASAELDTYPKHDKIVNYLKHLSELEKENAELKEQISTKDILIKELQEQKLYWKESSFDWRHNFFKKGSTKRLVQKTEQLTKAKEIIKYLLSFIQKENYRTRWDINIAEAEQFLKENE